MQKMAVRFWPDLLQVLAFLQHLELQECQSNPASKLEQQYIINKSIKMGAMRCNQKEICFTLAPGRPGSPVLPGSPVEPLGPETPDIPRSPAVPFGHI